jgi:hypothetical protein
MRAEKFPAPRRRLRCARFRRQVSNLLAGVPTVRLDSKVQPHMQSPLGIAAQRVLVAALVLGGFFAGYYWRGKNLGTTEPASPPRALVPRAVATGPAASPAANIARGAETEAASRRPGTALSADDIRQQFATVFRATSLTEKFMQLATVLQHLSRDNWRGALLAFEDARKQGEENPEAWALFVRRAGEIVGKDVVTHFVQNDNLDAARSALTGWASADPSAALAWIGQDANGEVRRQIVGAAIRGLALSEPDLAVSALEGISIDRRKNYVRDFVPSIVRGAGMQQTEEIVNGIIRRAAANGQAGDDYVKSIFADFAEIKARRAAVSGDVNGLADWVKTHVNQPYSDTAVVWSTAEHLARTDVSRALAWLDTLHAAGPVGEPGNPMGYGIVLATWANKEGVPAVSQWLASSTTHPRYDNMVAQYTKFLAGSSADEANRLAATIKNSTVRAAAQKTINEIVAAKPRPK